MNHITAQPALKTAYWLKSVLFFIGFQLSLLPLMVLTAVMGLYPIYQATAVQSIALTTLARYLIYQEAKPASLGVWLGVGLVLYATVGLVLGIFLQNRFKQQPEWLKLSASLLTFLVLLHSLIFAVQAAGWWHINSGW